MKNQNPNPIHKTKVRKAKALAAKRGIELHETLLLEYPVGAWFYCLHHEVMTEKLTEPLIERVLFVLKNKPKSELKVRFDAMRPVLSVGKIEGAWAEYEKIEAPASAKYEKIEDAALAEYEKIRASAWAEYKKIEAPALAKYKKIQAATWLSDYSDHPAWGEDGLVF